MKNNIIIIIPYFGKWPDWIDLYFYSCAMNSHIDWFFFTDCVIPERQYANIHFESYTFKAYCMEASSKLNFNFQPKNPYKLCGLKPFYGFIHENLLEGYDFWGWGDIDVVWGDIKSFYTDDMLMKYDLFSTHADRISGHFAIIKNTKEMREICFKIKNWKNKLSEEQPIALDEEDFSLLFYPEAKWIQKLYSKVIRKIFNWRDAWVIYYHLLPVINWILRTKQRKMFFKEQHTTPILYPDGLSCKHDTDTWFYKNGEVSNNKTKSKYIYIHFMIFKKNGFRKDHCWEQNYYQIDKNFDFSQGVRISKLGFEAL